MPLPARLASDRGQASLDWISVAGVVAAVLAASFSSLPVGDVVERALASSFTRAFCLVSGGDCLGGAPRPCVVSADERSRERRVALALLRLADGRTVRREDRSDGTVVVSVEDGARAGAGMVWGGEITVGGKGGKVAASVEGGGRGGRGRRFVLPDAAAADRVVARLAEESAGVGAAVDGGTDALVPDERWWVVGREARGDASLKVAGIGAGAELSRSAVAGVRTRPRTGERTLVLRTDGALAAALTGPLRAGLGMALGGRTVVELALDARGRPASLVVRGSRAVHGSAGLGPLRSSGGDLVEAEVRLDLADPVVREEVGALLDALGDVAPARAAAAARAIGRRLAERARVDLRLYATDQSSSVRGAAAGLLVKLGAEVEETERTARLVDAVGREPGLGWARRLDCVGVA